MVSDRYSLVRGNAEFLLRLVQLAFEGFRSAVRRALAHEREGMDAYAEELLDHSPYAER